MRSQFTPIRACSFLRWLSNRGKCRIGTVYFRAAGWTIVRAAATALLLPLRRQMLPPWHRRPAQRLSLVQRNCILVALGPVVHGKASRMLGWSAPHADSRVGSVFAQDVVCLLYTSDAADEEDSVDVG